MTNEAPEKIYVHRTFHLGLLAASQINITGSDVEYTRTDAFIDKAEEFLYKKLNSGEMECGDITAFVEDFVKFMKG